MKKDRDDFITALHARGIGSTRLETEFIWKSCCDHAMDWLINEERPVDMWFVRLRITPLRPGWKIGMTRALTAIFLSLSKNGNRPSQKYRNLLFGNLLTEPKWLAMNGQVLQKFIEVEHTSLWRRTIRMVEVARKRVLQSPEYANRALQSIRRNLRFHKFQLGQWLAMCMDPSAKIVYGRVDGLPGLVPHRAPLPGNIGGYWLNSVFALVSTDDGTKEKAEKRLKYFVRATDRRMFELRYLEPDSADLRDGLPDVPGTTNGQT